MFRGTYEHSLDAKGRTSIPSRFREILQQQFDERLMLTRFDGCLYAFPLPTWDRLEMKIAAQPQFNEGVQAFQRTFIASSVECPIDGQGRILIPNVLREYAGLGKDIVFIGMLHRIEIWDAAKWKTTSEEAEKIAKASPLLNDLRI